MSAFIEEFDVGIYEETGRVRISVILHGGDAKYFSIPKEDASKLASDLSRAAHDVDPENPHHGRVPDDPEGLEDVRQVLEDAGVQEEP